MTSEDIKHQLIIIITKTLRVNKIIKYTVVVVVAGGGGGGGLVQIISSAIYFGRKIYRKVMESSCAVSGLQPSCMFNPEGPCAVQSKDVKIQFLTRLCTLSQAGTWS